jgi:hypothetical protein
MANRTIIAAVCVFFCIATLTLGCKKGCGTCRSYGSTNTGYLQPYSTQVCVNNFCTCLNGLEGDSCQIYSINKYFQPSATWIASDACSPNQTYYVNMTSSSSYPYSSFYINNLFNNSGTQVQVNLQSTANNQSTYLNVVPSGAILSGIGVYQSCGIGCPGKITLTLDYESTITGTDQTCVVILSQQ